MWHRPAPVHVLMFFKWGPFPRLQQNQRYVVLIKVSQGIKRVGVLHLHPESIKAMVGHVMFFQHLGGFVARIKMASIQRARRSVLSFQWSAQHGAVREWSKATIRFNHARCIMLLSLHRLHPAGRVRSGTLPKVNYKLGYRASRGDKWERRCLCRASLNTHVAVMSTRKLHEKNEGKKGSSVDRLLCSWYLT